MSSLDVDYEKFGGTIADLPSISGNRNDNLLSDQDMITAYGVIFTKKLVRFTNPPSNTTFPLSTELNPII